MPFSRRRLGSVAYSVVMFIIVSVLAGVLVAGLFVPMAGLAGLGGRATATELDNLPAQLETPTPSTRSKVLMANGEVLAYFYDENRIPVALSKIAPVMRSAQLAIEDHRFYQHGALDLKGTLRALVRNTASDGSTQGGSTISQQYVKMVQVEACQAKGDKVCAKAAVAPTVERKVRELRYAIALEKQLSKDEILERYLNIAYYGQGAYGVEAAAKYYFSTSAARLNLSQAALLAGLVQNPDSNNPVRNAAAALDRRDVVLNRMTELKIITAAQAAAAKKAGFSPTQVKPTRNGCVGTRYPFLCDYVRRTLLKTPSLGATVEERDNAVKRGGLTIQTAIDPKTQDIAQKKVSSVVGPKDPLISTMNMIQPGTGLIVAMAQSRPVMGSNAKAGQTYWNLAVEPGMGGIQGYQAGSTFKAFTAAAALEKGIPLSKKYNARRTMNYRGRSFETCNGRMRVPGRWKVSNSTGRNGRMDMYKAAAWSVNNYFVQLELATGMCRVTKMAEDLGVKVGTPSRPLVKFYQRIPAFTLGSVEVSPLSMAEAYATFAARGIHCDPIIIDAITARTGERLPAPSANCKRVLSQDVADGMNKLMAYVMTDGTGRRVVTSDRRVQAGKTGTINSNEAVWFAGYTPEIAGVSMISIDNRARPFIKTKKARRAGQFRRSGVKNFRVPSTGVRLEGSGSGDAGMKIWKPTMNAYLRGVPKTRFNRPSRDVTAGKQVPLPSITGLGIRAATRKLEKAGFSVESQYVYSTRPIGTFLGWSQRGGKIAQFSTLYVLRSNGREDPAVVAARRARARERADERREAAANRRKAAAERREDAERARAAREAEERRKAAAAKPPPATKAPAPPPPKPGG
ncbi:MAG TPA: transglycosylase domain-containing protein [Propionibacteriaceae bacterium]|nr:transglycosylase domain-containing protein [Propionibacteriaceae bacterium]